MLIYLWGSDAYRRSKKLSEIADAFKKKHPGCDVARFSLAEAGEAERLLAFLSAQSLFGGPKLAVLTDLADAPAAAAKLVNSQRETKGTTLIAVSDKKLASPFTFLSKKPVLSQAFGDLNPAELETFAVSEATLRGFKVSAVDAKALAVAFRGDTWGLVTEIEKMALGADRTMAATVPAFFALIQSLKSGDLGIRLGAASRLIEREDHAAAFNVAAGVLGPTFKKKMADYDILVKSGKLEYEEAILDFSIAP